MKLLDYVAQTTGKGFEFRTEKFGLTDTWASVKLALGDIPNHIVLYHPDHRAKLGYLVAHECGHILRFYEAPPDSKKLLATNASHRRNMVYELEDDLYRLAGLGFSVDRLGQFVSMWHEGLIRQLGNAPVDMRIERWLHEACVGLRPLQRQALLEQLRENAKVLGRRVRDFTPGKVYSANVVMNVAYSRYVSLLLGDRDYSRRYKNTESYPLGRRLADEIWESADRGYQDDVETIDRWSHLLGLDEWWEWKALESKEA